ncbi:uncharacterized protein LOC114340034 isoform X2 [Diabrotica virgifera virgifera]|nr:uncharacterized protein LOC114340034 isoform X2 [Diabrotica virgifera virgifera]XP_050515209.1 uncharacterized protein LOC114340034 isoform X2 [Diabrotica virgifera virgifera]
MTATEKRHSFESSAIDPVSFMYVDPYDVNPLSRSSDLPPATILADIPLKVESSVSQQSQFATGGGVFYVPPRRIKLEMEEFGDLSSFVSPQRIISNAVDELNTPVFDKDAFDFDISSYQTNVQAHLMLKCDAAFFRENSSLNPLNNQEDVFINPENMHRNAVAFNNQQLYTDADIYSPTASENGTYIVKQSPDNSSMFDMDINSSVSVRSSSSRHSSYPSSPVGSVVRPAATETPDDSEMSFQSSSSSKPRLSLDLGLVHQTNFLDVNTPSIIAEVVSLESTGFNILDLVKEDDIQFVNDVFPDASTSTPPSNVSQKVAVKQPRRRHRMADDDDDEDYVPPSMKTSRYPVAHDYSSDSEDEKPLKKKARGRPPKRTQSISSDCSKDSDVSKYRELRDKNNEASRKSRMKRKVKELEMDKEADELHNKNIKLKAQVEELEKMVNNFRDNLFKIMINK